jgi:hypothetical protein
LLLLSTLSSSSSSSSFGCGAAVIIWMCLREGVIGGYRQIIISRILSDGLISWYAMIWSKTETDGH